MWPNHLRNKSFKWIIIIIIIYIIIIIIIIFSFQQCFLRNWLCKWFNDSLLVQMVQKHSLVAATYKQKKSVNESDQIFLVNWFKRIKSLGWKKKGKKEFYGPH